MDYNKNKVQNKGKFDYYKKLNKVDKWQKLVQLVQGFNWFMKPFCSWNTLSGCV